MGLVSELRARGLDGVPAEEWDRIAALGFDAVWLMGVWERSPAGTAIALRQPSLPSLGEQNKNLIKNFFFFKKKKKKKKKKKPRKI